MTQPPDRPDEQRPPESTPTPTRKKTGDSDLAAWYRLSGVGVEFIVAVVMFGGIGWWLDGKLNTRPWLMLAGGVLGFIAGLWMLVKSSKDLFR